MVASKSGAVRPLERTAPVLPLEWRLIDGRRYVVKGCPQIRQVLVG